MQAKANYSGYFETGSAARKREYVEIPTQSQKRKRVSTGRVNVSKNKVNNNINIKKQIRTSRSFIAFTFVTFIMAMFVTYSFSVINEKNLQVLALKEELASAETALLKSQMEVEKQTDLNKVEAYAKQQLGMQKPDKNQTVYIDTSKVSNTVYTNQDTTILNKVVDKIKTFFINIF